MGFMSFVNASSEHNLVPWITEHMHPKDTRGTVLYNLHLMERGKRCSREVEGIRNIRGHSNPPQIFITLGHTHMLHH